MTNDREVFQDELCMLLKDPKVLQMRKIPQHGGTNTLRHSLAVAERAFALAEKFRWDIDEKELARGALLHDYYLYDIKKEGYSAYHHGTSHPKKAAENAEQDFGLTAKEKNIILGHMWPLTLRSVPSSKEAALVCMADKDIAFKEMVLKKIQ